MGIWEWIGSTAEAVKRNAPDVTPARNACSSYGGAAITNTVNGLYKLGQLMPDDETKSKIGSYATVFAKNAGHYAIQEGYQLIPGGAAFAKIVSKTMDDVKHENLRLKVKDVGSVKKHVNGEDEWGNKSPEEVIRAFMMKDLFVNRFLDGVIVSEIARKKGKKPE